MDRFIDKPLFLILILTFYLKSNMDRFIGFFLLPRRFQKIGLKSNIDRFIVCIISDTEHT